MDIPRPERCVVAAYNRTTAGWPAGTIKQFSVAANRTANYRNTPATRASLPVRRSTPEKPNRVARAHSAFRRSDKAASAVRPEAIASMRELGIDISGQRSKHVDEFDGQPFDYVLTVSDNARETCPVFFGAAKKLHQGSDYYWNQNVR